MTMHFVKIKSTSAIVALGLLITFQQVAWSSSPPLSSASQADGPRAEDASSPQIARPQSESARQEGQQQQQVAGGRQQREAQKQDDDLIKHNNVHKLMSKQDLRRTFQVDSHDLVPEYEILKLTVHEDGSHLISPISDLGELDQQQQQHHIDAGDHLRQSNTKNQATTSRTTTDRNNNLIKHSRHKRSSSEEAGQPGHAAAADGAPSSAHRQPQRRHLPQQQRQQTSEAKLNNDNQNELRDGNDDDKLIVMNLSTFGREFKLRLKRNADFQQRIKDMKMFMAESTGDGQLRYTEIKSSLHNNRQQQHQHPQEPHKRAVTASDQQQAAEQEASEQQQQLKPAKNTQETPASQQQQQPQQEQQVDNKKPTSGNTSSEVSPSPASAPASSTASGKTHGKHQEHNLWNIGSTYHDEDNLAALLIEQDGKTGQLQVDGTIGNDFVIKPMPAATLEALALKRRQQQQRLVASASSANINKLNSTQLSVQSDAEQAKTATNNNRSASNLIAAGALEKLAAHLHDDDPHDDDEMFLDEDEALELAHLQASALIESNHTSQNHLANPLQQQHELPQLRPSNSPAGRQLSKTASERKWKKYRKLMAQTQVPKPHQQQQQQQQQQTPVASQTNQANVNNQQSSSSSPSQSAGRARRHAQAHSQAKVVQVSHHIVYRQKPSSEASSSEHQHSFMFAPGQQSMEEMALRFLPGGDSTRIKRSADMDETSAAAANMIDSSRLSAAANNQQDADYAHDPMGGQFYLEPGSITGFERAGYSDWSLMGAAADAGRRALGAPPPYLLNGTALGDPSAHLNSTSFAAATANNNNNSTHQHLRYKRHARNGGPMRARGSQVRRKRQAPDTVWPEVLLVVDYDSFLLHGGDSRDVKRYFVSFWNGVDLRYKLLVHPHIRISLAGMIVAKDRDATPYLERNRLRAPNADAVDAAGALTDMGKYLYREDRLPTYDLAVVITKLDMCRRRYEGGRCNRGTAGFAYVGGACVVNKRLEKVNSVAIIEDSGGFSGIIVAAHEVGHLLGCVHDGSPPPSYLGGPGATHCPWEEGFIMSDLRHTERGFRWSQCSVEQFKHFLNGETATCLYNYPHESQMLHRLLPGTMLSLDEQCKRDRGTNACFKDARVCAQLFCFDSASGYCVSYRPAAEGSPCGEGQVCRNGKCVGEIENIIPDYTHQSQTVVARRPLVAPPVPPHPAALARLADNGLSASSTSTATSSPDAKGLQSASSSAALAAASPAAPTTTTTTTGSGAPPSSRRMDTFLVDTPLMSANPASTFGSRYATDSITSRSSSSLPTSTTLAQQASSSLSSSSSSSSSSPSYNKRNQLNHQAKQFNAPIDGYHQHLHHQQYLRPYSAAIYQSRSGHQAPPTLHSQLQQQHNTGIVQAKSLTNQKRYRQQ